MPLDLPRPPGRRRHAAKVSATPAATTTRTSQSGFRLPPKRSPAGTAKSVVQATAPTTIMTAPFIEPKHVNTTVDASVEVAQRSDSFRKMPPVASSAATAPEDPIAAKGVTNEKLPEGWAEYFSDDGRPYFVHEGTGTVTWDRPEEPAVNSDPTPTSSTLPPGWTIATTEDGQTYYYNEMDQRTSWEIPVDESAAQNGASSFTTPSHSPDAKLSEDSPGLGEPEASYAAEAPIVPMTSTPDGVDEALPPGWMELKTEDGTVYYFNEEDGSTSWERPMNPSPEAPVDPMKDDVDDINNDESPQIQSDSTNAVEVNDQVNEESSTLPVKSEREDDEPLPSDWMELTTEEGAVYYYNQEDGTTSWERPTNPSSEEILEQTEDCSGSNTNESHLVQSDAKSAEANDDTHGIDNYLLPPGWSEIPTEDGGVYYYNEADGSTSWERPHFANDFVKEKGTTATTTGTIVGETLRDSMDEVPETFVEHAETQSPWAGSIVSETEFVEERQRQSIASEITQNELDKDDVNVVDPPLENDHQEEYVLPPGWSEAQTDDGAVYYYNEFDGSTSWERPHLADNLVRAKGTTATTSGTIAEEAPMIDLDETPETTIEKTDIAMSEPPAVAESDEVETHQSMPLQPLQEYVLPPGWSEAQTPDGEIYYYNEEDGTTSWERPHSTGDLIQEKGTTVATSDTVVGEAFRDSVDLDDAPETSVERNNGEYTGPEDSPYESVFDKNISSQTGKYEAPAESDDPAHTMPGQDAQNYLLPPGWFEQQTEDGQVYYYSQADGSTSWERPHFTSDLVREKGTTATTNESVVGETPGESIDLDEAPETSVENIDIPPGWKETKEDGMTFFRREDENNRSAFTAANLNQRFEQETTITPEKEGFVEGGRTASVKSDEFSYEDIRHEPEKVDQSTGGTVENTVEDTNTESKSDVDGWVVVEDEQGSTYYYNKSDGRTSWEKPDVVDGEIPFKQETSEIFTSAEGRKVNLPSNWHEMEHEDGRLYYYNDITGETTWDRPELLYQAKEVGKMEVQHTTNLIEGNVEDDADAGAIGAPSMPELDDAPGNSVEKLPKGWCAARTDDDDEYYVYEETGEVSWVHPLELDDADNPKSVSGEVEHPVYNGIASLSGAERVDPEIETTDKIWIEAVAEDGEIYYVCEATGETSWEKPLSFTKYKIPPETETTTSSLPKGWVECKTAEGESYYFHEPSNKTSWEKPIDTTTVNEDKSSVPQLASTQTSSSAATNSLQETNYHRSIGRRPGASVSFSFGGKFCFMEERSKGSIVSIRKMYEVTQKKAVCELEEYKTSHGISGPLSEAEDAFVVRYIDAKSSSGNDLWQLVAVAQKSKGQLKSSQGASNPGSPEARIVQLLLRDYQYLKEPDSVFPHTRVVEDYETVEKLLLRGQRREAVNAAIACGNFAMAMLIANMEGHDVFQDAARTYLDQTRSNGKAIHTLALLSAGLLRPPQDGARIDYWDQLEDDALLKTWKHHLAGIISNPVIGWDLLVIALGERLSRIKEAGIVPAHFCFLVCGGSIGLPSSNAPIWLLGHDETCSDFTVDEIVDAFALTEAYEWSKRQGNRNACIASLQAVKVWYALILCDYGYVDSAKKYLDSCIGQLEQAAEARESISSKFDFLDPRSNNAANTVEIARQLRDRICGEINQIPNLSSSLSSPNSVKTTTKQDLSFVTARLDSSVDETIDASYVDHDLPIPDTHGKPPSHLGDMRFPNHEPSKAAAKMQQNRVSGRPDLPQLDIDEKADRASLITPGAQAPRVEQERPRSAPKSAPANLQANSKTGEKKKSFFSLGIKNSVTKWLNPDATTADLGDGMEAYFDEDKKVWVFPGEDPAEKAKPIAPPPMVSSSTSAAAPAAPSTPASDDPLAAMMAPPPRSLKPSAKKASANGPGAHPPGMMAPPSGKPPVNFAAFAPKKPADT